MSPRAPRLWVCKLYYFTNSFGLACLLPFLPLFYAAWGCTKTRVGALGAVRHLVGAWATPLWNGFADRTKTHNVVHASCVVAQACLYARLALASHEDVWPWLWYYVVLCECVSCPTASLADSASGLMCRRWNRARGLSVEDDGAASYGKQRLWGAVSWGLVASPLIGVLMSRGGAKVKEYAPFVGWWTFLMMSAVVSTQLQHDHVGADDDEVGEEEEGKVEMTTMSGDEQRRVDSANDLHALTPSTDSIPVRLWNVVKDPSIALRFFLFLMAGASMTITDVYLFLWLQECGGTPSVMGAALFCTCVTEVVIFYHGAAIKRALTLDWCLILTPFCYFLRQFYYWLLPSLGNAWFVLPVQFLHGITFGLYWSTANDFIQDIAPTGLTASMTGLFSAVNAAGGFSGAVLGGIAYDAFGGGRLFLGIGLINLFLGAFFTTLKLRFDRGDERDTVAYTRLENDS